MTPRWPSVDRVIAAQVMEEQRRVIGDGELSYDKLMGLQAMRRALSETLRLYPPLIFLMRKV